MIDDPRLPPRMAPMPTERDMFLAKRIAEFKAAMLVSVKRSPGMEKIEEVDFHPDALLDMVKNGFFDETEDEWQDTLKDMREGGEHRPVSDDDASEGAEIARERMREVKRRKRNK